MYGLLLSLHSTIPLFAVTLGLFVFERILNSRAGMFHIVYIVHKFNLGMHSFDATTILIRFSFYSNLP